MGGGVPCQQDAAVLVDSPCTGRKRLLNDFAWPRFGGHFGGSGRAAVNDLETSGKIEESSVRFAEHDVCNGKDLFTNSRVGDDGKKVDAQVEEPAFLVDAVTGNAALIDGGDGAAVLESLHPLGLQSDGERSAGFGRDDNALEGFADATVLDSELRRGFSRSGLR
jgi:hypothetical protein